MPVALNTQIFQTVEQCLSAQLCQSLGGIHVGDLDNARAFPVDFGPMSIWSRSLSTSFPKTIPPKLDENVQSKKRANLVEVADSIIRMVAEKFKYENDGVVEIPDFKRRVFSATKGTFEGLGELQRDFRVQVRASPPSDTIQTFSFTFGIPKGHVTYANYRAFRLLPFVGSLCADVQDLMFTAVVQMDFGQKYCRPNLKDFGTSSSGTSKSYTCGQLSLLTNPIMKWFVNAWDTDIVQVVEHRVEWAMAAYIYDKFDCENFRPKKKNQTV